MDKTPYTVGIDPGLVETGIVLLGPGGHMLAGLTYRAGDGPDLQRIVNLADTIVGAIKTFVYDHKIERMQVAIEYPVMRTRGNTYAVETYRKQINLLHEIEAAMWRWREDAFASCHDVGCDGDCNAPGKIRIVEVNPSTSKRVVTGDGDADKDAMVAASPYAKRADVRKSTREALADAWAHAVAARLASGAERDVDLEELVRERLDPRYVDTRIFDVEVK